MKRIVLGLSIVAAVSGCARGAGTPTETVQEVMRKLDRGECAGLGDHFTQSPADARQFMSLPSRADLERSCTEEITQRKGLKEAERRRLKQVNILDQREEGDRASVRFELEMQSGEKEGPGAVVLVRQNDRWRIDLAATRDLNSPMGGGGMGPPPGAVPPPELAPPTTPPTQPEPAPRNQPAN